VVKLHRLLHAALPIALLAMPIAIANAQSASADQAKALLKQGIEQFEALEFQAAKATLLKVMSQGLSQPEIASRDDYLGRVDAAIQQQQKDRQTIRDAEQALREGDAQAAIKGFEAAAGSQYITQAERDDAQAKLALAREKEKAAKIPEWKPTRTTAEPATQPKVEPEPAPATQPAPVIGVEPKPEPATKPAPTPVVVPEPAPTIEAEPLKGAEEEPKPTTEPAPVVVEPAQPTIVSEPAPVVVQPQPEPIVTEPEPVVTEPGPAVEPMPEPVVTEPEPAVEPMPEPVVTEPEPAVEPMPEPVVTEPEPAVEPMPEPVVTEPEPAVEPMPEPVVTEPKPAVEPVPEPVVTEPEPVVEPEPIVGPKVEPVPVEPTVVEGEPTTKPAPKADLIARLQAERDTKAKEYVDAGKQALSENKLEEAVEYFGRAVNLAPDNAEAKRLFETARRRLAVTGEAAAMSRYEQRRLIALQISKVEVEKKMKKSREVLAAAARDTDFDEARSHAHSARNMLESNQNFYPPDEYRDKLLEIDRYLEYLADRKTKWEKAKAEELRRKAEKIEEERIQREEQARRRKMETLTKDARLLRGQQNYKDALAAVEQLLKLDPRNPWGLEQRDILEQFVLIGDRKLASRDARVEESRLVAEIKEKMVPWYQVIHYPRNWEEIRKRAEKYGATAAGESEQDRAVRQKLKTVIPQLDFDEIPFRDVVEFLRNVSGVSIFVNWRALTLRGIDKTTEVTVHLTKVPVETALRVVLNDVGGTEPLEYVVQDAVVYISTKEDMSRRTLTRVYDIQHLLFRVPHFIAPRMDLGQAQNRQANRNAGGAGGGLWGGETTQGQNVGEENVMSRSEMVDKLIELIKGVIDPPSWTSGEAAISETQGQLIVTQTARNHQDLALLLNQLREATGIQISIEARFLQVNTYFLNSIGVDFDFYFNLGSTTNFPAASDPFTGAQVPVRADPVGRWGGRGSNRFTPIGVRTSGAQRTVPAFVSSNTLAGLSNSAGINSINSPALSIAGVFLDDVQVDFLIEATQAHEATRSLTAPRITLLNGQRSYVTVGSQQGYISGYDAVASTGEGGDAALLPQVDYVGTGATLDVEAVVTADRKYVILTLRPQVSTVRQIDTVETAEGNPLDIPLVDVQDLQTTVMVPDGGTLLLGGQTIASEIERELGVPVLSKVPIMNRLFTNRGKLRDQETLLFLVKPVIIIQEDEEQKQFPL